VRPALDAPGVDAVEGDCIDDGVDGGLAGRARRTDPNATRQWPELNLPSPRPRRRGAAATLARKHASPPAFVADFALSGEANCGFSGGRPAGTAAVDDSST
jgi:hypothetical protein